MKRAVATLTATVVFAVSLGVLWLWLSQERLIFPGAYGLVDDAQAREKAATTLGASQLRLATPSGDRVLAWHVDTPADRAVLFVGGNFMPIEASARYAGTLREMGWDTLAIAPRGWPGSEGTPSEAAFEDDVGAGWAWLTGPGGLAPDRIVLMGTSLGGGAVGTVLDDVRPAAWVFQSTFDALQAVAQERYPGVPVGLLLRHPFRTVDRIGGAQAPVLIVHGDADGVVPIHHGRALADAVPDDLLTYVEVPGGGHARGLILDDPTANATWVRFLEDAVPTDAPR